MIPAPQRFEADPERLKALVLYICYRCPNPRLLGKTKLHKILYYSDLATYLATGSPITGETYVKHQYGPISAHLDAALDALVAEGALAVSSVSGYSRAAQDEYVQSVFMPLKTPAFALFTAQQISIVDGFIDSICRRHTARSISAASHDRVWKAAQIGETLPYATAFLRGLGSLTSADVEWARQQLAGR